MQKNPKSLIVIDSNVIISAAINPNGAPAESLKHALDNYQLAFNEQTYEELLDKLKSDNLKFLISAEKREEMKDLLKKEGKFFEQKLSLNLCRDPEDNKFISLAEQEKAKYLVSGDKDLHAIDRKSISTEILTPRQFVEQEKQLAMVENYGLTKEQAAEFEKLRQQKRAELFRILPPEEGKKLPELSSAYQALSLGISLLHKSSKYQEKSPEEKQKFLHEIKEVVARDLEQGKHLKSLQPGKTVEQNPVKEAPKDVKTSPSSPKPAIEQKNKKR